MVVKRYNTHGTRQKRTRVLKIARVCFVVFYTLSFGIYFAPAPFPFKARRSAFTNFCNSRNACEGVT